MSSWNFKDNLTIDNGKFLKFLDVTGVTKNNILGLDINSHLYINSSNVGDIYLNSNTTNSNTFINSNNSIGNTFVASKLAIGINTTSNMNTNLVLPSNGIIGLNSTQGGHSGFLALVGSSSLLNTTGSKLLLYGNDNTNGNNGQIKLSSGNNPLGNINIYTGNDILRMQVLNNGNTNFQPDGTTIRLSISDASTNITNNVIITSTDESTGPTTGALQIHGGIAIGGNTFINGSLNVNSVLGNINFTSSTESTSYTTGATYFVGGLGVQCSTDSFSQTAGGALSVAGGFALGKSAKIGGNITIYDSSLSTSSLNGSGIFYGGVGVNGQLNIRSNAVSQIRLIPVNTGNETSLFFGNQNNYTTSGSWTMGQNVNNISQGNFGIYNREDGNYIILEPNNIILEKQTSLSDTLNFTNNAISNLITIRDNNGDINWSIGQINEDFQISRFSSGNLTNYLITSDSQTGNITIYGTENSISSVSGGSLTVNGGASIIKDLYIGGDMISSNINFSGNIISNSNMDVNSLSYLRLTSTDESLNSSSGSLITFGGISIRCTTDTTSSTNGGSFITDGGAGIAKSLIVGNTISSTTITTINAYITNNTLNNVNATNITSGDIIVTNISSSSIYVGNSTIISGSTISSETINATNVLGNTKIQTLLVTSNNIISNNITSGSIITSLISTNSLYSTYSTITNILSNNNTISNLILTNGSFGSLNISNGLVVSNGINSSFNSNTIGTLYTTDGNVGINTINPSSTLHISGNTYVGPILFSSTGVGTLPELVYSPRAIFNSNTNGLPATLNSVGNAISLRIRGGDDAVIDMGVNSGDGSWLQSTNFKTYNLNYPLLLNPNGGNVSINTTTTSIFTLDIKGTIRSQNENFINNTNNNITNNIGSVNFSGDIVLSNISRNSIIFNQTGINPPTLTTRSIGTKLNLYPNISDNNLDYAIGVENNSMWYTSPSFKWYSNITSANMILNSTGLGINTNNINPNFALEVIGTGKISSHFSAIDNSNTLGNLYTTAGNVGINTVIPNYTLDVTGTGRFTTSFNAQGNSNTIGNLFTTGGNIGIQNTSPNQRLEISSISYAPNQTGGLRVGTKDYISFNDPSYRYIDLRLSSDVSSYYRGSIIGTLSGGIPTEYEYLSFSQNGFTNIYSQTVFTNTTNSTNSSIASVVLSGGLSIDCPTNATNVSNGGALTVLGGASISGDLIVGGSILYSNEISSTFAKLILTSTEFSNNINDGSLITYGGISIQCTANASSSTQGNGLTVAGGVGIGANLYVGTNAYIPNLVSTNNSTVNAVFTNTTTTNAYITNGLRSDFNSNTLGNIFTTGGNVGIGLTNPLTQLHVNNNLRIGGDAILDFGDDTLTQIYRNNSQLLFTTNNIDRIAISSTGNVGIGNIDPLFSLDITGITNIRTSINSFNSTTGSFITNGGLSISNTANSTSTTSGGALTIAGGASIEKDVYIGGTVTSSSDKFLKKNIRNLPTMLDKIEHIYPIKYNSINEEDTRDYIGFIAQDFEDNFPELLRRENKDSFYSLGYDRITALNFKCIKELLHEINKLKEISASTI